MLPRPRTSRPSNIPEALLNSVISAGKSKDEYLTDNENSKSRCWTADQKPPCFFTPSWPSESAQLRIKEDWRLLNTNLTETAQWMNLLRTPRTLLAWIGEWQWEGRL